MKVQQLAIYESLKDFMVAIGYEQASERREGEGVWPTRTDNNFRAMMEIKFGVDRNKIEVPTKLELVHEGITSHEAWAYREELEFNEGEDAPEVVAQAAATEPQADAGEPAASAEATAATEPAAPEVIQAIVQEHEEQQSQEQTDAGTSEQQEPAVEEKAEETQQSSTEEQPAQEEQQQEQAAEEGGDSEQE